MFAPTSADMERLKRLGRYLLEKDRHQLVYKYQDVPRGDEIHVKVHTDIDFAGCMHTRRSTSGGVFKLGFSRPGAVLSLSSFSVTVKLSTMGSSREPPRH